MFVHRYSINNKFTVNSSFFLTQAGYEDCKPLHHFGPIIRDHNLLHFVFSGKGYLEIYDKKYYLSAGQGFLIPTGTMAKYTADAKEPWLYGWIGFDGDNSVQQMALRGLSTEKIIFEFSDINKIFDTLKTLISAYEKEGNNFLTIAKLFEMFSYINPKHDTSVNHSDLINELIIDIEKNYKNNITVEDLSKSHNISRSQIFRLFKSKLDISPQQYIKYYRINHAADLLRRTDLSIDQIMRLSGFSNLSNFSRQFKSVYCRSPKDFREYVRTHVAILNFEHSPDE